MPFREIDRPNPADVIELPKEKAALLIPTPSLSLYKAELAFWRTRKDEADRAGEPGSWTTANEALRGIRKSLAGRFAVEQMLAAGKYDPVFGGDWFMKSVFAISHTRLMRQVAKLPTSPSLEGGFEAGKVGMVVDCNEADVYRSGLHVTPQFMQDQLAMEPPVPGQPRYFEGEQIYVTASAPADPTDFVREAFEGHYGMPFNPDGFVSIVPRPMRSYWENGVET